MRRTVTEVVEVMKRQADAEREIMAVLMSKKLTNMECVSILAGLQWEIIAELSYANRAAAAFRGSR